MESRYLEETVTELQSRIKMINSAINELRVSSMTLDGLEKEKKGTQPKETDSEGARLRKVRRQEISTDDSGDIDE